MKIRIDKMLSNSGFGSRKEIKTDAKKGFIEVNGAIEKNSSRIIDTDVDIVKYNGETVKYTPFIYLMMNKPSGVVSATEDNYDKTVIDLLQDEERFYKPFPVGRLDKDSEGLLLITNDGKLAHDLLSPKKHVDKTYYVEVAEEVTEDDVKAFEEGVVLKEDNYKTLPAKLEIIESGYPSICLVTIKEGKFHQVKRMFEAVNNEVTYLKRISMGPLKLDETLKTGQYRHLTENETDSLLMTRGRGVVSSGDRMKKIIKGADTMILGMPALVEYTSLRQLVELCMKLNLSFIELNMNLPYNFIQNLPPGELKKITKDTNIKFTMHMPDGADLGSFYNSVRKGYIELFSDTLGWAKEAGVDLLNLHILEGAKMTMPDRKIYVYEQYSEEFTDNFIDSIKALSIKAQKNNIILAIENSSNFDKRYIQDTLDQALKYPNIKLTWDTGHDAVSSFKDQKYLLENTEHIAHMHLHDAKGNNDHQALFDGGLDIKGLLKFAQSTNIKVLIEVKTEEALIKSINRLTRGRG